MSCRIASTEECTEELTTARVSDIARHIRSREPAHPVGVHQLSGSLDQTSTTRVSGFRAIPTSISRCCSTAQGVNTPDEVFTWTKTAVDLAGGRYALVVSEISSWDKPLLDNGTRSGRTNLRRSMWQAIQRRTALRSGSYRRRV